jgi:hypothetical protein
MKYMYSLTYIHHPKTKPVLQTTAREILINPRDLSLGTPIARGGSGVVRRGRLYGAVPVAAKSLYSQYMMGDLEEAIGAFVYVCMYTYASQLCRWRLTHQQIPTTTNNTHQTNTTQ